MRERKPTHAFGSTVPGFLRDRGHSISVIDATFIETWNDFEVELQKESPSIIGISFSSPFAEYGFKTAKIIKKIYPDKLVVVEGGKRKFSFTSIMKSIKAGIH